MPHKHFFIGLLLLTIICSSAEALTFNNVVSLGDSLLDDSDGVRSPVAAEHVAERLGVPLTKFARSGSTSDDLIDAGQHTQAAAQFGEGDLAMLWIGGNDFFSHALGITFGLYGFLDDLEANVDTALSTLRGAGMEVVVFNLPDLSNIPATDFISNMRKATDRWNDRLDVLAATHNATVIDVFDLFQQLAADPRDFSLLGNTPILDDPPLLGECQFCVFADAVHPSSFAQGFIANVAIDTINGAFDPAGTMPLKQLSIVEIALLADVYGGDFDGNNIVDANDLAQWQNDFGGAGSDADGDADTDGGDYLVWQRQFGGNLGAAATPATTIPEPTTAMLTLLLLTVYVAARPTKSSGGLQSRQKTELTAKDAKSAKKNPLENSRLQHFLGALGVLGGAMTRLCSSPDESLSRFSFERYYGYTDGNVFVLCAEEFRNLLGLISPWNRGAILCLFRCDACFL